MQRFRTVLLLLDYTLPDMSARQLIERLASDGRKPPFVIMTSYGDEQLAVDMMKLGARDYIIKQKDFIERLSLAIERAWREIEQDRRVMRAEQAQLESERRFREILETVNLIAVMLDCEGVVTFCNDFLLRLTGWQREDLLGQNWLTTMLPPDAQDSVRAVFDAVMQHGSVPARYENEILTKSGERRMVAWINTVLRDADGRMIGINSLGEDITERQQLEANLLQLRKAVETMHIGVTVTDLNRRILYTNPADAAMHGYHVDELLGQYSHVFAPAEFRQPASLAQIESAKNWIRESVNVTKDGTRFPVQLTSDVVRGEQGKPFAIVTACEDISERKQVENILRQEHNLLRTLIDNIPDYIFVKDEQERFLINNRAHIAMCKAATQEELIGNTVFDVFPPDLAAQYQASDREVLCSGEPLTDLERRLQAANGHEQWLLTTKAPLHDEQGKTIGIVGISRDITAQKQTEQMLQKTLEQLEQRVQERTGELLQTNTLLQKQIAERERAEKELQQAKERAEAANLAKTVFLTNMSHELRTPLNAVLGYAQMLAADNAINPKHREQLLTIYHSGEHLLLLINDILDLSKIETGRMELSPNELYLPYFLKNIEEMLHIRAAQKGLSFRCECDPQIPASVCADEKRLRQVLLNLLGNAVKFTVQGTVLLKIERCRLQSAEPPETPAQTPIVHLQFSILDTGIGIAPEHLDKIFLPFHRVGKETYQAEGTGLGLTISYQLVAMMGGELKVESSPGQGSRFWFTVPMPQLSSAVLSERAAESNMPKPLSPPVREARSGSVDLAALWRQLPPEVRQKLVEEAERGNVKGVLEQLDRIDALHENFLLLTSELRGFARKFQVDTILDLLERFQEQKEHERTTAY